MKNKLNEAFEYFYANAPKIIDDCSRFILALLSLMILTLIIRNLFFSTL